jgi:hypothetical protein
MIVSVKIPQNPNIKKSIGGVFNDYNSNRNTG